MGVTSDDLLWTSVHVSSLPTVCVWSLGRAGPGRGARGKGPELAGETGVLTERPCYGRSFKPHINSTWPELFFPRFMMGKLRHRVVVSLVQGTQLVSAFLGGRSSQAGAGLSLGLPFPWNVGPCPLSAPTRPVPLGVTLAGSWAVAGSAVQEAEPAVWTINGSRSTAVGRKLHPVAPGPSRCPLATEPSLSRWARQGGGVCAPQALCYRSAV